MIGSFAGSPTAPAWVHNVRAHPRIEIEVPGDGGVETLEVDVTEVGQDEWDELWQQFRAASDAFDVYITRAHGRKFPLFRLSPV